MPSPTPLIAFGCGHFLLCCRRSNACETALRACRHLAKGTDRRTDGRIAASLYAPAVERRGKFIIENIFLLLNSPSIIGLYVAYRQCHNITAVNMSFV